MHLWILLVSILNNPTAALDQAGLDNVDEPAPATRYRGIDTLLAKFDAEEDTP